ncbi:hypothetical protein F66182_1435 [Fusarium sp. NRRL 66182]|nr:hypothetical protein F66182_1435 [Fusarium sp. NRRL 66182]
MRYNALMMAFGLLAADSALASPCKPRTTTSDAATTTSETIISESTTSVLATSTEISTDATETTSFEATTTTAAADVTTTASEETTAIASEDITTTVSEATTTIASEDVTITVSETATTTTASETTATTVAADTTMTTSEAETSTTSAEPAPAPTQTFSVVAQGGGSVDGATLQGNGQQGTIVFFNPNFGGLQDRSYTVESSTGRLRDDASGSYMCAFYGNTSSPDSPVILTNCFPSATGPNQLWNYITCEIENGKLSCAAPKGSCQTDNETFEDTCTTAPEGEVHTQWLTQYRASGGNYIFLATNAPAGYTALEMAVREV